MADSKSKNEVMDNDASWGSYVSQANAIDEPLSKKRDQLSTVEFMLYTEGNGNAQGTDSAEQTKPPM